MDREAQDPYQLMEEIEQELESILVQLTGQLVLEKSLKVFMNVMIKR